MRTFLVVTAVLLAACELVPPPKPQPSSQTAAVPGPTVPVAPPNPADPAAPSPVIAPPPVNAACSAIAVHVAATLIANATDPAARASLEQERTRIVRRTAEACTNDKWSEASISCFAKATTVDEMQICGKDLAAPREDDA